MGEILGNAGISSPFHADPATYHAWRADRLQKADAALKTGFITIHDPANLAESERREILLRCQDTNIALYRFANNYSESELRTALREMAESLGMGLPEGHRSAGDKGIVALTVSDKPLQKGYIPYSRRAMNWHTDGYYNAPETEIRGFILHCARDASHGGHNRILDPAIAYIRLRDENPAYIAALTHPRAMSIPENVEPDGTVRPVSIGPVFAQDAAGNLTMRYTARTRSINWRDDATTREAAAFLQNLLTTGEPLMREIKLSPGQGVLNNNVLHNRTGFDADETGNHSRRLIYRIRFHKRIGEN